MTSPPEPLPDAVRDIFANLDKSGLCIRTRQDRTLCYELWRDDRWVASVAIPPEDVVAAVSRGQFAGLQLHALRLLEQAIRDELAAQPPKALPSAEAPVPERQPQSDGAGGADNSQTQLPPPRVESLDHGSLPWWWLGIFVLTSAAALIWGLR